jgi:hypothetical protein
VFDFGSECVKENRMLRRIRDLRGRNCTMRGFMVSAFMIYY